MAERSDYRKEEAQSHMESPAAGRARRAAVYVNELAPRAQRTLELNGILEDVLQQAQIFKELVVYGADESDADDGTRELMARHEERGTKVSFAGEEEEGEDETSQQN